MYSGEGEDGGEGSRRWKRPSRPTFYLDLTLTVTVFSCVFFPECVAKGSRHELSFTRIWDSTEVPRAPASIWGFWDGSRRWGSWAGNQQRWVRTRLLRLVRLSQGTPGSARCFRVLVVAVTGYLSFVPLISDHSHPTAGGLGVVWHTQNTHKRALRKGDTRRCWVVLPKLFLSTNFSDGLLYARLVS